MNWVFEKNLLTLQGDVNALNMLPVLRATRKWYEHHQNLITDWQGVTRGDSACLALMLTWLRDAKKHHKQVQFLHVPGTLLQMAQLYGIDAFLFESSKVHE